MLFRSHCLIGNMNVGGIETMLMELYRNIDRSKFQFDFVVHSKGENFYEKEIYLLGGKISVVALRKTAKFGIEKLTENTY